MGLSEREYAADIVLWPIQFTETSNKLEALYDSIEKSKKGEDYPEGKLTEEDYGRHKWDEMPEYEQYKAEFKKRTKYRKSKKTKNKKKKK